MPDLIRSRHHHRWLPFWLPTDQSGSRSRWQVDYYTVLSVLWVHLHSHKLPIAGVRVHRGDFVGNRALLPGRMAPGGVFEVLQRRPGIVRDREAISLNLFHILPDLLDDRYGTEPQLCDVGPLLVRVSCLFLHNVVG